MKTASQRGLAVRAFIYWLCYGLVGITLLGNQALNGEERNQQSKQGMPFAKLSLHITDAIGQQFLPDCQVYLDRGGPYDQPALLAGDIIDPPGLLQKLRAEGEPIADYLRAQFSKELRDRLAAANPKNPPGELVEAVRQALDTLLAHPGLFEKERFAKVAPRPETQQAVEELQGAGASPPPALILKANRYLLEDAFPSEIRSSRALASLTTANRWAEVPPGKYWVIPSQYPPFAQKVTVQAGETLDVNSASAKALILTFRFDEKEEPEKILLTLKPAEQRRAAIAKIRRNDQLRRLIALPRPGCTPEQMKAALGAARENLAKYCAGPTASEKKGLNEEQLNALYQSFGSRIRDISRIFAVAGEPGDEALITKAMVEHGYPEWAAEVLGYLEARQGLLRQGSLLAAVKGTGADPRWPLAAAIQLHSYGLTDGDAKLLDILRHPPPAKDIDQAELPAFALLDRPDAPVLEAMRSFFAGVEKSPELKSSLVPREWGNPTVAAILYLLAYGRDDDWRKIAGCDLCTYHAAFLATEVDDPLPLARWLAKHGNIWRLAVMSAALRDDPTSVEGLVQRVEDEVFSQAYNQSKEFGTLRNMEAEHPVQLFQCLSTFWRPQVYVAQWFLDNSHDGVPRADTPWQPWRTCAEIAEAVRNDASHPGIEYLPHEEFIKSLPAKPGESPSATVREAAHRVSSRAFYSVDDYFHDGIERRSYTLRSIDSSLGNSAVSGILEVEPSLNQGTLRLALRFRQQGARSGVGFFPSENHKATEAIHSGGKSLIEGMRLRRGDHLYPLTERAGDNARRFLFEATLDQSDLSGLYFEIDLRLRDEAERAQLVFDLFGSDCAHALRAQESGLNGTPAQSGQASGNNSDATSQTGGSGVSAAPTATPPASLPPASTTQTAPASRLPSKSPPLSEDPNSPKEPASPSATNSPARTSATGPNAGSSPGTEPVPASTKEPTATATTGPNAGTGPSTQPVPASTKGSAAAATTGSNAGIGPGPQLVPASTKGPAATAATGSNAGTGPGAQSVPSSTKDPTATATPGSNAGTGSGPQLVPASTKGPAATATTGSNAGTGPGTQPVPASTKGSAGAPPSSIAPSAGVPPAVGPAANVPRTRHTSHGGFVGEFDRIVVEDANEPPAAQPETTAKPAAAPPSPDPATPPPDFDPGALFLPKREPGLPGPPSSTSSPFPKPGSNQGRPSPSDPGLPPSPAPPPPRPSPGSGSGTPPPSDPGLPLPPLPTPKPPPPAEPSTPAPAPPPDTAPPATPPPATPTQPVPARTAVPPSSYNSPGSSGPVPPRQPAPPPPKGTVGKIIDWIFGGKH